MNDSRMKIITDYLCGFLPGAQLKQYVLPDCPEIKLWLLDDAFDDEALSQSQVEVLSDDPFSFLNRSYTGFFTVVFMLTGK